MHRRQAPSASSVISWRGSTVRLTRARQSAKPDPALTSHSRQGPKQEDSVTAQDPTLLIFLFGQEELRIDDDQTLSHRDSFSDKTGENQYFRVNGLK